MLNFLKGINKNTQNVSDIKIETDELCKLDQVETETQTECLIKVSEKQTIQLLKYSDIKQFINWNKNRKPDESRIAELKDFYIKNNTVVIPGIIYAWDNDSLEIYDGIHRLLAAKDIYDNYKKNFTILLSVLKTSNENDVILDFKALNKSCPVPILYTEESSLYKRRVCEDVVSELCKRYIQFVSPSRKPYQHNFNRDNTLDWLSEFDIDWTLKGLKDIIIQELNGLNFVAKDFVSRNHIQVPKKCDYHNFYLWYLEKNFIRKKIENAVKHYYNLIN